LDDVIKNLQKILQEACLSCESNTIALSGGLDSSIIAYLLKDRKPNAVAIIAEDYIAKDLVYCQRISKELKIPLTISYENTLEILNGIQEVIKILKNFNDIEIRNNVVMYLVIKWVKNQGGLGVISGDGADELFAGYNFLLSKSNEEIEKEINRICSTMHFPSHELGKSLGVKIESPFLDERVIELAKKIPAELKVKIENNRIFGKWILRKSFENSIPHQIIWREKSPMQDGAGTTGLESLFNSIINDDTFSEKKERIKENDGIIIRTKESLYYYDIYRKIHGAPKEKPGIGSCPFCNFNVENSKFCRRCGAFPI
jgi:asparagine synthase (glutamine-hydrolysing)